ncbi:hypothetical protein [Halorussus sp. MSC15.2]|uniref:hypothetical protein n=1 Tax=Halorussus sp. MSC15.2 TaxID=2283638 RepID=UPI0013D2B377|nr:hypothetical protein [Halorussus sp. MSC15.2]NEU57678.1 hypothetical protein [Halorussus sp. MSC15.2]
MRVLVDATTLVALGRIGELDLLSCLDGSPQVVPRVEDEVTTEPARTNLQRQLERDSESHFLSYVAAPNSPSRYDEAKSVLGEPDVNGDVEIITDVLHAIDNGRPVGVVSDDQRVRTVARGLGATVTGTIGVIVRAVEARDMTTEQGKELVRRVDSHGLHMTGELREKAYELVEDAAKSE